MTLQEYMNNLEDDKIVAIGSKSQYFFIGTKEEFEEDIDKIDKILADDRQRYLQDALVTIENIKKLQYEEGMGTYDFAEKLIHSGRALKSALTRKENLKKAIRDYKPIRDREVIDEYESITENVTRVIVPGYEQGTFWFRDEYKNMRAQGKYKIPIMGSGAEL
jgi:hypothetical protein